MTESIDVGTDLDGCGMSIATQRAKEHQNRTPDVEDMAETRNQLKQLLNKRTIQSWVADNPVFIQKPSDSSGQSGIGERTIRCVSDLLLMRANSPVRGSGQSGAGREGTKLIFFGGNG